MNYARFQLVYGRLLALSGLAVSIGVLFADLRWLHQTPEILVMAAAAVWLRGEEIGRAHV